MRPEQPISVHKTHSMNMDKTEDIRRKGGGLNEQDELRGDCL